jgi:D-arabinose 1-dehydrogenase-like Zn-dependent alcohol dehydrogenase
MHASLSLRISRTVVSDTTDAPAVSAERQCVRTIGEGGGNGRSRDRSSTGGADQAIALAVSPSAFEQAYKSLRRGGTLVFVALPADNEATLPIFETVLNGITVVGSIVGTRTDLREVFELHTAGSRTSRARSAR